MNLPATDSAADPPWRVIGTSVRGTSHLKANLPCQDVLRWQTGPGSWLLAALADGAGSAALAEVGARIAAERGLAALDAFLRATPAPAADDDWRAGLTSALKAARAAVFAEADQRQTPPRELASTLTLLAISPDGAAAAQVGDGAALAGAAPESLACLTRPAVAEYLNETTFLVSDPALDTAQITVTRGAWRHAALFCDGLQLLALRFPAAAPHGGFFQPLFRFLDRATDLAAATEELGRFLQSPRITGRADDDLSLLLATCARTPAPPPGASS